MRHFLRIWCPTSPVLRSVPARPLQSIVRRRSANVKRNQPRQSNRQLAGGLAAASRPIAGFRQICTRFVTGSGPFGPVSGGFRPFHARSGPFRGNNSSCRRTILASKGPPKWQIRRNALPCSVVMAKWLCFAKKLFAAGPYKHRKRCVRYSMQHTAPITIYHTLDWLSNHPRKNHRFSCLQICKYMYRIRVSRQKGGSSCSVENRDPSLRSG